MSLHLIWNKEDFFQYSVIINNVQVTINSHNDDLHFAPFPKRKEVNHKIVIWYDAVISDDLADYIKNTIMENPAFLPVSIVAAYTYLGLEKEKMQKHINKYVKYQGEIFAHYAFPSDDFYVVYNKQLSEIFVWGNHANLERVLVNILSMSGEMLPFHAACVELNGKGYMIVGDTYSGKTSLVLNLMHKGANYIADDILYVDSKLIGHRCCEYLSIREKYLNQDICKAVEFSKGDKVFLNTDLLCQSYRCKRKNEIGIDKIILIAPLTEEKATCTKLFCAFRHDSMIINELLGGNIREKIDDSMKFWGKMMELTSTETITINHKFFLASLEDIYNIHFIRRTE